MKATVEISSFKHFSKTSHNNNAGPLDIVNRAIRKAYGRSYEFIPTTPLPNHFHISRWAGFVGVKQPDTETYLVVDNNVHVSVDQS